MCAWKRGVSNNQAGPIRKGQIKEFQLPSSQSVGVHEKLLILNQEDVCTGNLLTSFKESPFALVCTRENGLPSAFNDFVEDNIIYLHAHANARFIHFNSNRHLES